MTRILTLNWESQKKQTFWHRVRVSNFQLLKGLFGKVYRYPRIFGGSTELIVVSRTDIEAVPSLPECRGTGIEVVLNVRKCRVPVLSSCRTLPACSVGYGGRTARLGKFLWTIYRANTSGML